mgnify:CR=1 FL=1
MRDTEFFQWLDSHQCSRTLYPMENLLSAAGGPERVAVLVVDLIKGFCNQGPLSSPMVGKLVQPTVAFLRRAHELGIRSYFFPCDAHPSDSPEFSAFPPHCVEGTTESEVVDEVASLEFAHLFRRIDKGSVCSLTGTGLVQLLEEGEFTTLVCCGDCTDLCLYQMAVGLRFYANQHRIPWRIIVPQSLVATYDLPVLTAQTVGALPHPSGLMNDIFLYHLELNGVEVVADLR